MPLKTWNGSSFVPAKTLRVWNGSSWVSAKSGKIWNGSAWISFFTSFLDTQTFTVSDTDIVTYYDDPIGDFQYDITHGSTFGTISPGTSSVYTGANVNSVVWTWSYGVYPSPQTLFYYVVRPSAFGAIPNSGWTTLTINDSVQGISTYTRTSMTFSSFSSGGNEFGSWSINTADPFYPPDTFQPGTTHSATASLS